MPPLNVSIFYFIIVPVPTLGYEPLCDSDHLVPTTDHRDSFLFRNRGFIPMTFLLLYEDRFSLYLNNTYLNCNLGSTHSLPNADTVGQPKPSVLLVKTGQ